MLLQAGSNLGSFAKRKLKRKGQWDTHTSGGVGSVHVVDLYWYRDDPEQWENFCRKAFESQIYIGL